jgi:hypothetical protein
MLDALDNVETWQYMPWVKDGQERWERDRWTKLFLVTTTKSS